MRLMSSADFDPTWRVQAEQVSFRYPQHGHGLDPTVLRLQPGDLVHIHGPSGCGKSTLARCLTGLIPHLYRGELGGRVWLDGLTTHEAPLWQLAEHAGMVFQNPAAQMLASSVEDELAFGLENLGLAAQQTRARVDAALLRFGLLPLRTRSPTTLSGGEQQKLALAAMMAREPAVLVLDEPFSMLDSTAVAALVDDLGELARSGVTMVVCEHRPEPLQAIPGLRLLQLRSRPIEQTTGIGRDATVPELHLPSADLKLSVQGLTVRLGAREILDDLSFLAHGGEIIAVVGRNGVGKTTLLRTLAGLQPYQGTIGVNGERPDLGMVFQNADLQLFNASVREEVLHRVTEPDMILYQQLLDALGLTRYELVPPLLLSEGEKKRVALATVLMRRPRHGLLLDEPALGQDSAHKSMLMHIARGLAAGGQLVIITTHDLTLASQADRMLLLGEEGIVADGPPPRVLRDPTPWKRIGLALPSWLQLPAQTEAAL